MVKLDFRRDDLQQSVKRTSFGCDTGGNTIVVNVVDMLCRDSFPTF